MHGAPKKVAGISPATSGKVSLFLFMQQPPLFTLYRQLTNAALNTTFPLSFGY
jgi:hypothetical protein